ncbi:MAG: ion transporter [bacterium]
MKKIEPLQNLRSLFYEVIFESNTPAGKLFDVVIITFILISVAVVMLDTVPALHSSFGSVFYFTEWFFTLVFTVEYFLRLFSARRASRYAFSFYGSVDLLSVIPTYLNLILAGSAYLLIIRILRILRIFRVLKLMVYTREAEVLIRSLLASRRKILIFLCSVATLVIIFGSLMYVIEGEENGFTSIPRSVYWAVVTLTTVGYGDIAPKTSLGRFVACLVMLLGYSIIAVPTGIVTVAMSRAGSRAEKQVSCGRCGSQDHDADALYCKRCGSAIYLVDT